MILSETVLELAYSFEEKKILLVACLLVNNKIPALTGCALPIFMNFPVIQ